jgi:hypothetical protein
MLADHDVQRPFRAAANICTNPNLVILSAGERRTSLSGVEGPHQCSHPWPLPKGILPETFYRKDTHLRALLLILGFEFVVVGPGS